jgi:Carboxypeptidase regulatory-like domain
MVPQRRPRFSLASVGCQRRVSFQQTTVGCSATNRFEFVKNDEQPTLSFMKRIWMISALLAMAWPALAATITLKDGDWAARQVTLSNTPEAAIMVRVGDIDNLGFGWPANFDPFSGATTPGHPFPWTVNVDDPPGTDRIMVITSYVGKPPAGADGYATSTKRPDNEVQPITLDFAPVGLAVADAAFQIFVDDFQAPSWGAKYTVTLNGDPYPELETIINSLVQTGPVGKLISVPVPLRLLSEIASGRIVLIFDDLTSGAGDGYAIDFVKLLVNRAGALPVGTVSGNVVDAVSRSPLAGATVRAFDRQAVTDSAGNYTLTGVPAGLAFIEASAPGYETRSRSVDLLSGQTVSGVNLELPYAAAKLSIFVAVELEFFARAAAKYALQYSPELQQWINDEIIVGEGKLVTRFRSTRTADKRYWRVIDCGLGCD